MPSFVPLRPRWVILGRQHLEFRENQAMIVEEDYGYWNPTPYFGGGGGDTAPIPHAKVSCSEET